ncbi:MAG: aspartate carbamoyltransferase catalytic subunit [Proteobacteria bacterium]|nr:MAG: aspartate carbamoyltransferase catalytic subunit [Pseudomonadota bacterium]
MSKVIKHLLGIEDLNAATIRAFLDAGKKFKKDFEQTKKFDRLHGKTVVSLFYEASTRTRGSFEMAAKRLGADFIHLSADASSSVSKGETLVDTAKNLEAMNPDFLVLRHPSSGAPQLLAKHLRIPVINAGDGFHEHPTQALLDALTIEEKFGSLKGLQVTIVGDIAHSRVARSNIHLLGKMGAKVTVCGPPTLIPPHMEKLGVKVSYDLSHAIRDADVVMMLRIQFERQNDKQIPSTGEYFRCFGLHAESIKELKKEAIIMHPGPMNRGVEISAEVADGERSVILNQVTNGVAIRAGVLSVLNEGIA